MREAHYPVCCWLRPACEYLKRLACLENNWDGTVASKLVLCCAEVQERLEKEDPVTGLWNANANAVWTVYCDASDVAVGAMLVADGNTVED